MFPIVGNVNRKGQPADGALIFRNSQRQQLAGISAAAVDFIETEQPYHWNEHFRGHWLWVVHDLNRIDKHRRIAVTTAYLDFQFVSSPEGLDPRIKFHRAEGPIKDGDVLVTYSGTAEGVNAQFTRGVALNEGAVRKNGIDHLLPTLHRRVEWVVTVLERIP